LLAGSIITARSSIKRKTNKEISIFSIGSYLSFTHTCTCTKKILFVIMAAIFDGGRAVRYSFIYKY
jgi:hypothetical protein